MTDDSRTINSTKTEQDQHTLYCSLCGKSQHEVKKLIAGATVYICDECITLCYDIVSENEGRHASYTTAIETYLRAIDPAIKAMLARDLLQLSFNQLANITVEEYLNKTSQLLITASDAPLDVTCLQQELADTGTKIAALMERRTELQTKLAVVQNRLRIKTE